MTVTSTDQTRLCTSSMPSDPAPEIVSDFRRGLSKREGLAALLEGELDFHGEDSGYASHHLHAFAPKFPPQLPRAFMRGLTLPGDVVLDPMMGSGTTFDLRSRNFVDYWFLPATQRELMALALAIRDVADPSARRFLELPFSSTIVTKSGGVSRARDLAHSRPHLVDGKVPKNAFVQFALRLRKNLASIAQLSDSGGMALPLAGDARALPIADGTVNLVVTSPLTPTPSTTCGPTNSHWSGSPTRWSMKTDSMIEQRMHEEYIIGLYK